MNQQVLHQHTFITWMEWTLKCMILAEDNYWKPRTFHNAKKQDVERFDGDFFPSPHSNKFVLQFPNAPLQEFTLEDLVDSDYGEGDCGDPPSAITMNTENGSVQQLPAA